jgi:ribosome-associated heat shock protein Hsp15
MAQAPDSDDVRLDKWLWAARFFKTRGLASDAVKGGKVDVNGAKAKPSRTVRLNDEIRIHKGPYEFIIKVQGITDKRGPSSQAVLLYHESEESRSRRAAITEEIRIDAANGPRLIGRPNKRDRRQIVRFTRKRDT